MESKKIVLLFSGGQDSSLLLKMALSLDYTVHCIIIDYGQRQKIEVNKAIQQCTVHGVSYSVLEILLPVKSNLTSEHKTYEGVSDFHVPARNLNFVALAASYAESNGYNTIWYGANWEDRENFFPDCLQDWIYQMNKLLEINGSCIITLEAPLLGMTKKVISEMCTFYKIPSDSFHSGY